MIPTTYDDLVKALSPDRLSAFDADMEHHDLLGDADAVNAVLAWHREALGRIHPGLPEAAAAVTDFLQQRLVMRNQDPEEIIGAGSDPDSERAVLRTSHLTMLVNATGAPRPVVVTHRRTSPTRVLCTAESDYYYTLLQRAEDLFEVVYLGLNQFTDPETAPVLGDARTLTRALDAVRTHCRSLRP